MINSKRDFASSGKQKNYFIYLIKHGYLFLGILFAGLMAFLAIMAKEFNYHAYFLSVKNMDLFVLITLAFYLFITFVKMILRVKKGKPDLSDAIALSWVLFSVFLIIYCSINSKTHLLYLMCFSIALLIAGVVFVVLNSIFYDLPQPETYSTNKFSSYFNSLKKKYSFYVIFFVSLFATCFLFLFFDRNFSGTIYNAIRLSKTVRICFFVFVGLIGVWGLTSVFYKDIHFIDCAIVSCLISMPIIFLQIFLLNNFHTNRLIVYLVILAVFVIGAVLRYVFYKPSYIRPEPDNSGYFTAYFKQFNVLFGFASASTSLFFIDFAIKSHAYPNNVYYIDGKIAFVSPNLIPLTYVLFFACLAIIPAIIAATTNIFSKKINVKDVLTVYGLALSVGCCALEPFIFPTIYILVPIFMTAFFSFFLITRIISYNRIATYY